MSRHRVGRALAAALVACTMAIAATLAAGASATPALASPPPRVLSFSGLEAQFMCVVCHESLSVANSPEAYQERDYLRLLIAKRETPRQIKRDMVAAYTPAVLALPPAHGFNLLVYIVPPVVVAAGLAIVLVTLPRWRRRSRQTGATSAPASDPLDPADARRLDEDLQRFA
ncbi:MAG: cytochrome c-type biogenesis protein [Solirubrobacteraceae bacterium]